MCCWLESSGTCVCDKASKHANTRSKAEDLVECFDAAALWEDKSISPGGAI